MAFGALSGLGSFAQEASRKRDSVQVGPQITGLPDNVLQQLDLGSSLLAVHRGSERQGGSGDVFGLGSGAGVAGLQLGLGYGPGTSLQGSGEAQGPLQPKEKE